jgi:alkylhydroperoxidase/carboxymuconolactone decarboxylase family protein YurZ
MRPMIAAMVARRGSRSPLDDRTLWLIDIALVVACRAAPELVRAHLDAARENGLSRDEIAGAVAEAAMYVGVSAVEGRVDGCQALRV